MPSPQLPYEQAIIRGRILSVPKFSDKFRLRTCRVALSPSGDAVPAFVPTMGPAPPDLKVGDRVYLGILRGNIGAGVVVLGTANSFGTVRDGSYEIQARAGRNMGVLVSEGQTLHLGTRDGDDSNDDQIPAYSGLLTDLENVVMRLDKLAEAIGTVVPLFSTAWETAKLLLPVDNLVAAKSITVEADDA